MNNQILKLFGLVVVLFALLVGWTSRWTVFEASALNNNGLNRRILAAELTIKRGRILAADGTVLAESVPDHKGAYKRTYPTGQLFAQAVGYAIPIEGQYAGLEKSRSSELLGKQQSTLSSVFGPLSTSNVGDDVWTTLDPKAQRAAMQALGGQAGSVVALDPRTGAVKVMFSYPSYDDNHPFVNAPGTSEYDRALQGRYSPGSTFKVVSATAAVDSGRYTPDSQLNGNSPLTVSGVPLANDGDKSWGLISLTTALTYSVNTVFAQLAERVGVPAMTDYMKRFGFYAKPPLDFPADEMRPSDVFSTTTGHAIPPGTSDEDIGRIGIGQGGLAVTPMQMAMVAAAVANHGTLMVPHLTARVVNSDGQTVETITPTVLDQVMSAGSAHEVAQMMTKVVEEGTGQEVQLGSISVAGKTGTASIGAPGSGMTNPWFIAFAPVDHPTVAIAVTVDKSYGFGGQVAAPIVRNVLQVLLADGG